MFKIMSKCRSLNQQMQFAITQSVRFGTSKRGDKKNNVQTMNQIYSVIYASNIRGFIKTFAKFMKERYPEIRWVRDLKSEHVQNYIDLKEPQWTTATLRKNKCYFKKLFLILNDVYNLDLKIDEVDYNKPLKPKIKINPFKTDDFILLTNCALSSKSKFKFTPLLTATLGTRIEEVSSIHPEDIYDDSVFLRNCKNGRNRTVYIKKEFRYLWNFIKDLSTSKNWMTIVDNQTSGSNMDFLNKIKRRVDLQDKYIFETNHSIRKMFAQRNFYQNQLNGLSPSEAWNRVQIDLGHGSLNREDLFKTYIGSDYKAYHENLDKNKDEIFIYWKENIKKQTDYLKSFDGKLENYIERRW